jgi:hypothetical protein
MPTCQRRLPDGRFSPAPPVVAEPIQGSKIVSSWLAPDPNLAHLEANLFHTGSAINSTPSVLPFPNRECAPITLIGAATLKSIEASVYAQITAGRVRL